MKTSAALLQRECKWSLGNLAPVSSDPSVAQESGGEDVRHSTDESALLPFVVVCFTLLLLLVADILSMLVVCAELVEVFRQDISRDGVQNRFSEISVKPQSETFLSASGEKLLLVVRKHIGADTNETTLSKLIILHANFEDLVQTLFLVLSQPKNVPVDERIENVAVVLVHV